MEPGPTTTTLLPARLPQERQHCWRRSLLQQKPAAREAWASWQDASPRRGGGGAGALPAAGGTPWIPVPHSGVSRAVSGHSCSRNSSVCIPLCLPAMGSSSELALPKARHTVSADPCSGQGGLSCRAGPGAGGGHPSTVCPSSAVGAPLGRAAWGPGLWLAVLLWFSLAAAGLRAHKWKSGIWPGSPACWLPGGTQPLLVRPLAAPPLAS